MRRELPSPSIDQGWLPLNTTRLTCPFCPLRCHDLTVTWPDAPAAAPRVTDAPCELAARRLRETWQSRCETRRAEGDYAERLARAAERLTAVATLEIGGTATDLQTARAAVRFAAARGATLRGAPSRSALAFQAVSEREGAMLATLGEVAARCDSVVLLGEVEAAYPRLVERWLASGDRPPGAKRLLRIGGASSSQPLEQILATTRMAFESSVGVPTELSRWLEPAESIAWIWAPEALDEDAATMLCGLNQCLARDRRSLLVPIVEDGAMANVASWLGGFQPPIAFTGGLPRPLEANTPPAAEARIWLQPFPDAPQPEAIAGEEALIVIGTAAAPLRERAALWIPAAVPGWESHGTTLRGDGTVGLAWRPLPAARNLAAELPTIAGVLDDLAAAWESRRLQSC